MSSAPWTGIEIDEVNRVGGALAGKVGDDAAWFEEWPRMADRIEGRGRDALRSRHKLTAASCFMRAARYYQTSERFIHPRSQRSMEIYGRSVKIFKEAASMIRRRHRTRRDPIRARQPAGIARASGSRGGGSAASTGNGVFRRLRRDQGAAIRLWHSRSCRAWCRLPHRRRAGEQRERALSQSAADPETEKYATPAFEYLAGRREFDEKRISLWRYH